MDPLLKENLITTKEAGELSGYSSDYLSRLIRSGKIAGKKIGHSWLVDKDSLTRFVDTQGGHKIDRARALARARTKEYRAHHSLLRRLNPKRLLKSSRFIGQSMSDMSDTPGIGKSTLHAHIFALSMSLMIVLFGAFAARAAAVPGLATSTAALIEKTSAGFRDTFGDIPFRIAARIDKARAQMNEFASHTVKRGAFLTEDIAPRLAALNLSTMRMELDVTPRPPSFLHTSSSTFITADDLNTFAVDAYTLLTHPLRAANVFAGAHRAFGEKSYSAIARALGAYRMLIDRSGARALALSASARDAYLLALVPLPTRLVTGLGEAVIAAAHAAIRADVSLAYGAAEAAPASARAAVAFLGNTGDLLARAAERVPALATTAFLRATEAPAVAAPAIAQAAFNAEYAAASRFVAAANRVSKEYFALVYGTGEAVYASATSGARIVARVPLATKALSGAVQDSYLGALGTSALVALHPIEAMMNLPPVAGGRWGRGGGGAGGPRQAG